MLARRKRAGGITASFNVFSLFLISGDSTALQSLKIALCGCIRWKWSSKGLEQRNAERPLKRLGGFWLFLRQHFYDKYTVFIFPEVLGRLMLIPPSFRIKAFPEITEIVWLPFTWSPHRSSLASEDLHSYFPNGATTGPGHLHRPMLFVQGQQPWVVGCWWTFNL